MLTICCPEQKVWLGSLRHELFGTDDFQDLVSRRWQRCVTSCHLRLLSLYLLTFGALPLTLLMFICQASNRRPDAEDLPVAAREQLLPDMEPGLSTSPTLVLDLDETLIHTVVDPVSKIATTHQRPGLEGFLESVAALFEIVIFTAGLEQYASPLIDQLDPKGLVGHRLYRQHTRRIGNHSMIIKDLATLNRPLSRTVMVDNRCHKCLPRRRAVRVAAIFFLSPLFGMVPAKFLPLVTLCRAGGNEGEKERQQSLCVGTNVRG